MNGSKLMSLSIGVAFGILAFSCSYFLLGLLIQPEAIKNFIKNYLERGK